MKKNINNFIKKQKNNKKNKKQKNNNKILNNKKIFNNHINIYISKDDENKYIGKLNKKSNNYGFVEPLDIYDNESILLLEKKINMPILNKLNQIEEDVYIFGESIKLANSGDIVILKNIKIPKDKDLRKEAEIDKILLRNRKKIVGTVQKMKGYSFVVPDDKTFISDIFISAKDDMNAQNDDKVVVEILKYSVGKTNSEGRIVKILGNKNEPEIKLLSLLEDNEINIEFPEYVTKELEKIPDSLDEETINKEIEFQKRIDLRNLKGKDGKNIRIYTVDGKDTKDVDDAIAIEKIDNMYKVWIHIADVSYYIKENSKLDLEAKKRGNSIYLIDTVVPMLHKKISNGICSLNMNEDRFAFTVEVVLNKEGKIQNFKIYTSIIKVDKKINYNLFEEILNNPNKDLYDEDKENLNIDYIDKKNILLFKDLTDILINKRNEQGYINFELPEAKIELGKDKQPISIMPYEELFSHKVIEHLMILANEIVGKVCTDNKIPSIYRVHDEPNVDRVIDINEILQMMGISFNISKRKNAEGVEEEYIDSREYNRVLNKIKEKLSIEEDKMADKLFNNEEENIAEKRKYIVYKFLQFLLLRSLTQAKYSSKSLGHFGIGSKYYLHFTAPIRRYSDIFVHRYLKKYMNNSLKEIEYTNKILEAEKIAKHISITERQAQDLERIYEKIKKAEYMEQYIGNTYLGVITSIKKFGMYIELANTVEGLVRFQDMKDIYKVDDKNRAIGIKYNNEYSIGDGVNVLVTKTDTDNGEIDFYLVNEKTKYTKEEK